MAAWRVFAVLALGGLVSCNGEDKKTSPDAGALDTTVPADVLPADRAADDGGPTPTTGKIRGKVSLRANIFPPPPGDLAGTLVVAALDGVPTLGGQPVSFHTSDVDFSEGPATYELTDIPPGRYSVSAMLDDNKSFQPDSPFDAGDVINPLPAEVEVTAGKESTIDLVLDTPVPGNTPYCGAGALDSQKRQCVFDFVWDFAAHNYPFFELKAIDWDAVKAAYEPRVSQASTEEEFHYFVAELLAELRDGHCTIASLGSFGAVDLIEGVKLAHVAGEVYCERLDPASAAAAAGLQVGDRILSVDGKTFADHVAAFGKYVARPNDHWYYYSLLPLWLVGTPGSVATVAIERNGATLDVQRTTPSKTSPPLIVSKRLPGSSSKQYGYIYIATFRTPEIVPQFDSALDGLLDVDGLILDVRENGGGESAVGNAMIARLIDSPVKIAKDHLRGSPNEFVITTLQPRETTYKGPVVVLADESSYSNAHLFPSQLKEIGRATLVGRTTGGGSAGIEEWQLTDALEVRMSKALSVTANGSFDEELGTPPHVTLERTVADIKAGLYSELGVPEHDALLQRAIEELGN